MAQAKKSVICSKCKKGTLWDFTLIDSEGANVRLYGRAILQLPVTAHVCKNCGLVEFSTDTSTWNEQWFDCMGRALSNWVLNEESEVHLSELSTESGVPMEFAIESIDAFLDWVNDRDNQYQVGMLEYGVIGVIFSKKGSGKKTMILLDIKKSK
ncbi:MAG: hypothetical protein ACFFER_05250 [Candidatus Thorarchaeota archaeon]